MSPYTVGSIQAVDEQVLLGTQGTSGVSVQLSGVWVGTLQFEGSVDGLNFEPAAVTRVGGSTPVTSATNNGLWSGSVAGFKVFRVRGSAWTSGRAGVAILASEGAPGQTGLATEATLSAIAGDIGDTADVESGGNGSVIAILKRIRNLLGGGTTWTAVHEPAANAQATITRAAAGVGIRNVCTGFSISFVAGATAPTAVTVAVRLRDGATGAGAILWAGIMSLPATAGARSEIHRSGLWIEGSTNTQMTLEFSAAGGANTTEAVTLEGTTES